MNRTWMWSCAVVGAALSWACDQGQGPVAPEGAAEEAAPAVALSAAPDPSDPAGFNAAVGERVIVCKNGPTQARFLVDDGVTTTETEVAAGECKVVYAKDGATAQVTVREYVPRGQTLLGVDLTQLTCGQGVGLNCDPTAATVITGPTPAGNPVTGLVGGTGPSSNRAVWGRSGFVAEFTNSFIPGEVRPKGEQLIVCLRGVSAASVFVNDGTGDVEVRVTRGCQVVYRADGQTRTVTVRESPPRGYYVAQAFQTQLTCGQGLPGLECPSSPSPVIVGPVEVGNPTVGFVGGSGSSSDRSQKGFSGFVVEFFNAR